MQHPDVTGRNPARLVTEGCLRPVEGDPVRRDAEKCDLAWPVSRNLVGKGQSAFPELVSGQFSCRRGRPIDEVGDPQAEVQQLTLSVGGEEGRCQPGLVDGTPEAVARPSKVVAGRARPQPGVDADEKNAQVVGDDVLNGLVDGGTQIGRRRSIAGTLVWRARRAVYLPPTFLPPPLGFLPPPLLPGPLSPIS